MSEEQLKKAEAVITGMLAMEYQPWYLMRGKMLYSIQLSEM